MSVQCLFMQDWFVQPTVQCLGIQLELNLHGLVLKLRSVLVDGSSRLLFGVCLGENSLSWVFGRVLQHNIAEFIFLFVELCICNVID
jgi:hypothetical protein